MYLYFDPLRLRGNTCCPDPRSTARGKTRISKKSKKEELPAWDLTDLYVGLEDPKIAEDLQALTQSAHAFEAEFKGQVVALVQEPARLLAAVQRYEALSDLSGRLGSFASLSYCENTTCPQRQKFYGDVQTKLTEIGTHLLFFGLELNAIEDVPLEGALSTSPSLAHYRPWLEDVRRMRPFQLDEKLEKLFYEKSLTGYDAWNRLFDESLARLRFEVDGTLLELEPTLNLLQDPSPARRKAAAMALSKTFSGNLSLFTLILNTLLKDKEISDRWRGFRDCAQERHLANHVEEEVVAALVQAVRDAYPHLSHRYYALKAKWFGVKTLPFWERNAPLPEAETRFIPWTEAQDLVLTSFDSFSPEMARIGQEFFDKNWIDARLRSGKASGAFAHPTTPSLHPYILLNYQGKPRDVMTLAHELGHGVHQVLAAAQGPLMAPTPLTLAETASVFGETLAFERLLERATTPAARRVLLASKIEDMLNTVVRQIAFYLFERRVHEARRQGELTAEQVNGFWREIQSESLGPSLKLEPSYDPYWVYISHFIHAPFYVYAYAFGECLVNSLYAVYTAAPEGFEEKYFALLRAGGTQHHTTLLAPFGLNAATPNFWEKGLLRIAQLIEEAEHLKIT